MLMERCIVGGMVLVAGSAAVHADFVSPDSYGWARGAANSGSFAWNVFTSANGANAPDAGVQYAGPGVATLTNSTAGSLITGSGNIYNISQPLNVTVNLPSFNLGTDAITMFLVQVRSVGTELNLSSVMVNGQTWTNHQELLRQSFGGPPGTPGSGYIVETLFVFSVLPGNASSYTLMMNSAEGSMSLDRVTVDMYAAVPGPGAAGALALGTLAVLRRRR